MRSVRSGASNWRPRELAYLRRIISRTSSTRSSSLIVTSVAEAPGRFTQIFRVTMLPLIGSNCSVGAPASSACDPRSSVCMRVDCLLDMRDWRRIGPVGLEVEAEFEFEFGVRDGLRARGEEGAVVPIVLYAAFGERRAAEEGEVRAAEGDRFENGM